MQREVIVTETFDPDQQVARRTTNLDEQSSSRDQAAGAVDVAYPTGGGMPEPNPMVTVRPTGGLPLVVTPR